MTAPPDLVAVSLGGGVQSTAMTLMAADGRFGSLPDIAYFADTGWEPTRVYQTVEAVRRLSPFPVQTVSNGRNLARDVYDGKAASGNRFIPIPVFTGDGGMTPRQCSNQYKIDPIIQEIRRRLGYSYRQRVRHQVEQWMGISTDEAARIKDSRIPWARLRYPLIEEGLSRTDCADWLAERHPDVPVGKSACIGCPYHDQETWRRIALETPEDFAAAVKIDHQMRTPGHNDKASPVFLHRYRVPLDEAVAMSAATSGLFEDVEDAETWLCDSGACFI